MTDRQTATVVVHRGRQALADAAAARLVVALVDAQSARGVAHVSMTGGSMGSHIISSLWPGAGARRRRLVAGARVVGRRAVAARRRRRPQRHPERRRRASTPSGSTRPTCTGCAGPDAARLAPRRAHGLRRRPAREPATTCSTSWCSASAPTATSPRCSPTTRTARTSGSPAVAVHDSPKPPPTRVSLTRECLERSREVWFLVSGADKADAVRRGRHRRPVRDHPGRARARRRAHPVARRHRGGRRPGALSTDGLPRQAARPRRRPPRPDDDPDAVSGAGGGDELDGIDAVEEVGIRRLTADEEAALEAVRAGYAEHGIDPADLDSIAAAYDRALDAHDDDATPRRWSSCSAPPSATTSWRPVATGGWSRPTRSAPTSRSSHPGAACRW